MKYFAYSFLLILITSCSVQKRLYNKGFYVQKHKMHASQDVPAEKALTANPIEEEEPIPAIPTDTLLDESLNSNSKCDTVFLANGETVICTIDHTENEQLFILACEDEVIPKTSYEMKDVLSIHYANGDVEEIRKMTKEEQKQLEEKKIEEKQNNEFKTKLHPLYFVSLGLTILAVVFLLISLLLLVEYEIFLIALILSIGALVVSMISLAIHGKTRPKKTLGIGLSIGDVVVSAISVAISAIATFITMLFK